MIEINQAHRHSQKLDLPYKARPTFASEAEVPKEQCKKQTGPEGTLTHQVTLCDPKTACLGHLFELEFFKNAFSSAVVWAADFFLPLSKTHKVKQYWSGLRTPCLSNPLTTLCILLKGRCRGFKFSTLESGALQSYQESSPALEETSIWISLGDEEVNDNSCSIPWVKNASATTGGKRLFLFRKERERGRGKGLVSVFKNNCQFLLGEDW